MTDLQNQSTELTCPLCANPGPFSQLNGPLGQGCLLCSHCQLIFVQKAFLPDPVLEKARYENHQNGPQYAGYVKFLKQAITPTLPYLKPGMSGLDYGCGPEPTLSILLGDEGLICENYDPFFYPHLPQKQYDFVFATEVAEHFFHPGRELTRIRELLRPGGILTIMTEKWDNLKNFPDWHYANDFTHVCFYHARTIFFICDMFGFEPLLVENSRVSVLGKI